MARGKKNTSSIIMFCVLTSVLGLFVYSVKDFFLEGNAIASSSLNKAQIEEIVKDVIKNNPELIVESLRSYQDKSARESQEKTKTAISQNRSEIENIKDSAVAGNVHGDVSIIEFFDYRCGYCKSVNKTLHELLHSDKNVKVIYKQLPVLGEESVYAAKAALSVYHLDHKKFMLLHNKLMETANINKATVEKLVTELGIDLEEFKAIMDKPIITEDLEKTKKLAEKININGTPAFIINGEFVGGAIDLQAFKNIVADVRKNKK